VSRKVENCVNGGNASLSYGKREREKDKSRKKKDPFG